MSTGLSTCSRPDRPARRVPPGRPVRPMGRALEWAQARVLASAWVRGPIPGQDPARRPGLTPAPVRARPAPAAPSVEAGPAAPVPAGRSAGAVPPLAPDRVAPLAAAVPLRAPVPAALLEAGAPLAGVDVPPAADAPAVPSVEDAAAEGDRKIHACKETGFCLSPFLLGRLRAFFSVLSKIRFAGEKNSTTMEKMKKDEKRREIHIKVWYNVFVCIHKSLRWGGPGPQEGMSAWVLRTLYRCWAGWRFSCSA